MLAKRTLVILGLLLVVLSLVSCLGPSSPEAVVEDFTEACVEGDLTTADRLLSEISPLFGAPCFIRRDADESSFQDDKIQGNTATVVWAWEWEEPFRLERYEFRLSKGRDGWRIDDYNIIWEEYNTIYQEIESIAAPTLANQDPDLLESVAYIQQSGIEGSKIITKTARFVNGEMHNEAATGELVLQEPRSTIVVVGTRPRATVLAELKQQVMDYFTAYHADDYAKLLALTYPEDIEGRDLPAVHETAGLNITYFDVDEVKSLQPLEADSDGWFRSEPRRNPNLPGEPYVEPFILEAEVPAFVRYQIFGVDMSSEEPVLVVYRPDLGWKVHHWGAWAAAAPAESKSSDKAEVRLDGVALFPNSTLVVATRIHPEEGDLEVSVADDTGQGSSWGERMDFVPETTTAYAWLDALHPQAINVSVDLVLRPEGFFGDAHRAQMVTSLTR